MIAQLLGAGATLRDTRIGLTLGRVALAAIVSCLGLSASQALGDSLSGSTLRFNSFSGLASPPAAGTLNGPGYLGTYIDVGDSGDGGSMINLVLNATRSASGSGIDPNMNLVIADSKYGFTINSTSATNYSTSNFWLPAGKYVVRAERDTDGNNPALSSRTATVNTFSVSAVTGSAAFDNTFTTDAAADATALAAANTYIQNFRKGTATVELPGIAPSTPVQVKLKRNAFNFGGTLSGVNTGDALNLIDTVNPSPGTQEYYFQQFVKNNFNTVVPSNGGKWASNESTRDSVTMQLVDQQINFAQANGLAERMHNMLWGTTQQPSWVSTMLNSPTAIDPVSGMTNKDALRAEISERIQYYFNAPVAGYPGVTDNRAQYFYEVDILNEAMHQTRYWSVYGPDGIASIYNEALDAIEAATGSADNVRTALNEFNVLQFSPQSITLNVPSGSESSANDQYGNWYRLQNELVQYAGVANHGRNVVTGVGMQMYTNLTATGADRFGPDVMQKALQNYSVLGLPLSMTEFGLSGSTTKTQAQTLGPDALEKAMRMMVGTPQADTFMIWGWFNLPGASVAAALLNNTNAPPQTSPSDNSVLTPMGERWVALMGSNYLGVAPLSDAFTTSLTAFVNGNGELEFNGFYGDYELTIGGQQYALTFDKGTSQYQLTVLSNTGDFDDDNDVDADDIDILWHIVRQTGADPNSNDTADLNNDSLVNEDDVDYMLAGLLDAGPNIRYGDADLSGGSPELTDYNRWRTGTGGWAGGDFDGSGGTPELNDYNLWRTGPTQFPDNVGPHGAGAALVPEPATIVLMGLALPALLLAARRSRRRDDD